MKRIISFILLVGVFFTPYLPIYAEKPVNVLFIGNSLTYNCDMPGILEKIAESKGTEISTEQIVGPGYCLFQHWDEQKAQKSINEQSWDFVVLQEGNILAVSDTEAFYSYAARFDEIIRDAGAKTVFYMTISNNDANFSKMDEIVQSYDKIIQQLDATGAPAASVFLEVQKNWPDIKLLDTDNIHLNQLGAYITACTFYSVFFRQSPEGATSEPVNDDPYFSSLSEKKKQEFLTKLQEVTWETVDRYCNFEEQPAVEKTNRTETAVDETKQKEQVINATNQINRENNGSMILIFGIIGGILILAGISVAIVKIRRQKGPE